MTDAQMDSLDDLRQRLRRFAAERDWERFHTPKNLAMSVAIEAAELMEHFQWRTAGESASLDEASRHEVAMEAADVLLYLVRLADVVGIDLHAAAREKIGLNALKYPAPGL
ncbi:MAG TPA: nucleotide pyrophosphohydrolase [Burkholderiales bacterium]|nr:nucleotide pyrophosphohydrolase [Burkholderiales bacterium]